MQNSIFHEQKFKRNGIEMPFQCIDLSLKVPDDVVCAPPVCHYHEYIEILYSFNTNCDVLINNKQIPFKTGDLVIVNSGEVHNIDLSRKGADKNPHYFVIKVMPEIIYSRDNPLFELRYVMPFIINRSPEIRYFSAEMLKGSIIDNTISEMNKEWQNKEYGYEIAIRSSILKIFLWILRYWQQNNPSIIDNFKFPDETLKAIQASIEYVSENYIEITEQEVAEHCNLSYSYFSRTFKKVMNQSFTEYLNSFRLTKAEQMLITTDKSIAEISDSLGFSTPSYFIQQFKKRKSISPKQFRINLINNKN